MKHIRCIVVAVAILLVAVGTAICANAAFMHYYKLMRHTDEIQIDRDASELDSDGYDLGFDINSTASSLSEEEQRRLQKELEENATHDIDMAEYDSKLKDRDVMNILLVGVDSRDNNFDGRSDCIIVATVDKTNKQILLTSVLRDIYLSIPGKGNNRINASYAMGGTKLLKETLLKNFGMKIDRCIVFNFGSVEAGVDAVGGIDVDMSMDEILYMNAYAHEQNEVAGRDVMQDLLVTYTAGMHHLNGNQALAYDRNRYIGTDFKRTERQRLVIQKCYEKLKQFNVLQFNDLAEAVLPKIYTDLTEADCASLIKIGLDAKQYRISTLALPIANTYSNIRVRRMDVLKIDFDKNIKAWQKAVVNGTLGMNTSEVFGEAEKETKAKETKAVKTVQNAEETVSSTEETTQSTEETVSSISETASNAETHSNEVTETSDKATETVSETQETVTES